MNSVVVPFFYSRESTMRNLYTINLLRLNARCFNDYSRAQNKFSVSFEKKLAHFCQVLGDISIRRRSEPDGF